MIIAPFRQISIVEMTMAKLNVAVVGGGVAGVTTAYLLQRHHRVTLYEKNDYIGGHTHTISIPDVHKETAEHGQTG